MNDDIPIAKRPRLSMACNPCRRRKVKCDTDYPKCRNCRSRNDICTTTDPKMPHVPVIREWIVQSDSKHPDLVICQPNIGRDMAQISQHSHSPGSVSTIDRQNISKPPDDSPAASLPWNQDSGISPAQQPYDVAFNTDARTDRIKMMGGSSSQCLMKSLDVYLESAHVPPLSHNFQHGMRQAEEIDIPLVMSLPTFPETTACDNYVSAFFDKIHPLYPLFNNIDRMKHTIQQFALLPNLQSIPHEQGPLLVSSYLLLSLGADEDAKEITDDGTKYLVAAASLLGHVLAMPYLHAIQALLLFTIAYRGRNKDGLGWQTLGMAIRIAYTIGLHRHSHKNPTNQHGVQDFSDRLFHARIWAICCSLEKMMQLESGRPATILHVDRDHMMGPDQHAPGHDFLQWHMGLAQHQGLIFHHIYGHKPGERTAKEILFDTARLDRSLLSWAREIPEEFRPGNDLFCSSDDYHIAALLSIQYYQTIIALHRAALIVPTSTFQSEVVKHSFDDSSRLRLLAGEAICVSSARSIARLTMELSDRNVQSRILTAGPQLLACIVLGISLIKNTRRRIMAADLELLKACIEYTAYQYSKSGHNDLFTKGVQSIYQQVRLCVDRVSQPELQHTATSQVTRNIHQNSSWQHEQTGNLVHEANNHTSQNQNPSLHSAPSATYPEQSQHNPEPLSHNETISMGVAAAILPNPGPQFSQFHPNDNGLPFDNLDVQELWDWMGNLSEYDNYGYEGSY